MRTPGTALELEKGRFLAVRRLGDGRTQAEVAAFLEVSERTVGRWAAAHRKAGEAGLKAKPAHGRPPALTPEEEAEVLGWLSRPPSEFGMPTELWTCKRLAALMQGRLGVSLHPCYLSHWLRARGYSTQIPEVQARERDREAARRWAEEHWEEIKKKRPSTGPTSC